MRKTLLAVGLGLTTALLVPAGALGQRSSDWYRDVRPYLDGRGQEVAQRVRLWEEFARLRESVRRADRSGDISLRDADRFYDRLDRVAHFLRNDKNLSDSEYKRRRGDLDNIAGDFDRMTRDRYARRDPRR
jgi:hypothetical protein